MKNSTEEELGPSICPELSSNVIQTILEINAGLIKVCVEFQNKGWTSDPDFAIYQARLQSNLAYLAAVADHYLKPERKLTELPPKPNLTPLPDPRTVSAQMLKKLISKAKNDFENVEGQSLSKVLQRDNEAGKQVERDIKRREEDNKTSHLLNTEDLNLPVHISKRVLDPQATSENYQNYVPFPPLQLPDGISDPLVPPHLPSAQSETDNNSNNAIIDDIGNEEVQSLDQMIIDNNTNNDEVINTPQPEELVNQLVNQMFEINSPQHQHQQNINNFEELKIAETAPTTNDFIHSLESNKEEEEADKLVENFVNFPEEEVNNISESQQSQTSLISELIEQISESEKSS